MKYYNNRKHNGKRQMGRPRVCLDSLKVAKSFIRYDECFDVDGWYVKETLRAFILNGTYNLRVDYKRNSKVHPIAFMIFVPKYCETPQEEVRLKFNHTNDVRNALAHHNLRERLEGHFFHS